MSPAKKFTVASLPDLSGKTYIVTGGNSGIGYSTVKGLASKNAKVYMTARSATKAEEAIQLIKRENPKADIHLLIMDHTKLATVVAAAKEFASKEEKLYGLVNNAGIMMVPFELTSDGYEIQFQTNYIAHWLFTWHLMPTILRTAKESQPGDVRVVDVSSDGHDLFSPTNGIDFVDMTFKTKNNGTRYGASKLGNVLQARELSRRYGPNRADKSVPEVWTASLHPGVVKTNLANEATFGNPVLKTIVMGLLKLGIAVDKDEGALTQLFAVASKDFRSEWSGGYFVPTAKKATPSKYGRDDEMARKLWEWTESEMRGKDLIA